MAGFLYSCFFILRDPYILSAVGRMIFRCFLKPRAVYCGVDLGASVNGFLGSRSLRKESMLVDLRIAFFEIKLSLRLRKSKKKRH